MGSLALNERADRSSKASGTSGLVEGALSVLAVLALLPAFAALADAPHGRDQRFAQPQFAVRGLPDPVLPQVCRSHGALASAPVRERLCASTEFAQANPLQHPPVALADAAARTQKAFMHPVEQADGRLSALRLQQREGVGELLAVGDAMASIDADLQPFLARYAIERPHGALPLRCAMFALAAQPAPPGAGSADAILLTAAALDGHRGTAMLLKTHPLPESRSPEAACADASLAEELLRLAGLMSDARQAHAQAAKNEAMRSLLQSAGWQWAAWMLVMLAFLRWSRRAVAPIRGIAAALATWAALAWVARVPWPLAADRSFVPARVQQDWLSSPAPFVLALLVAALILAVLARRTPAATTVTAQTMASRLGFPGFVLASGLGWLLLLDLSAHAHAANRYLALYYQGHLWLALVTLSVLLFLRPQLARGMAWVLSLLEEVGQGVASRAGGTRMRLALAGLALTAVVGTGLLLANMRQLTSEMGRIWLILGAAWFFFLRGSRLAERLARAPGSLSSLLRFAWPLLFVVGVLLAWMLVTRDMGPLLISAYGAGAFVAAAVAMWHYRRTEAVGVPFVLAIGVFVAWIAALTLLLFQLGSADALTATRLESVAAPLASANDQLAMVTWFRQAAPAAGFGFGQAPWCGHAASGCSGVPLQIHSDYTFTAFAGVIGMGGAWAVTLGCAIWLHRLVWHHGRVTRGEPELTRTATGIAVDHQAFLSWICVAWVVLSLCQLAVTVAGNLAVLPLTGVTFPLVSYGLTSLIVNVAFLALCLNVSLPAGARHA